MLTKTYAMLKDHKPGTHVPDDVPCFDEQEIAELGSVLARLVYAPSQLRKRLQEFGVSITRADHYSEIPKIVDLEASFARPERLRLDSIFRDAAGLERFLRDLMPWAQEFDPPLEPTSDSSYAWKSCDGIFSYSDAMAYYCMIRRFQPETIIEMGSGASTLIASMACERNGKGRIIALEPFPRAFLRGLPHVELVESKAQDIASDFVHNRLQDGDFLFVDTTHTVKHDSDCLHIYLRMLPHVRKRIFVHAHDIFLPGTPSLASMRDHQIFWTEQYLLYAYLVGNPRTKVLYGSAYHRNANPALLAEFMKGRYGAGGGSLWFSQEGAVDG